MISSTAWASQVLSPATLHLVFDTVLCCCVTRPIAAVDKWPTSLTLGCSSPVAHCRQTACHCDGPLQPACHTSRLYLMSHLLHALRACGAAHVT
jgi:hypothetical protein